MLFCCCKVSATVGCAGMVYDGGATGGLRQSHARTIKILSRWQALMTQKCRRLAPVHNMAMLILAVGRLRSRGSAAVRD